MYVHIDFKFLSTYAPISYCHSSAAASSIACASASSSATSPSFIARSIATHSQTHRTIVDVITHAHNSSGCSSRCCRSRRCAYSLSELHRLVTIPIAVALIG